LSSNLSPLIHRRIAIAKQTYLHGINQSEKQSNIAAILSILNFDYSVKTLLKAVLLHKDFKLEHKSGQYRNFNELLSDLKTFYDNSAVIKEIELLHKLRNDIQHNAVTPSSEEVQRHKFSAKLFFDDICSSVYNNSITFDAVSQAFFIDSKNERIILEEMEIALSQNRFGDALHYARTAVNYHINLLREQMNLPVGLDSPDNKYRDITKDISQKFQIQAPFKPRGIPATQSIGDNYFRSLNEIIRWLVERIVLPEHYLDLRELFPYGNFEFYFYLPQSKEFADLQKADRARRLAYNIIIETQWQLKQRKDKDCPIIFDSQLIKCENDNKVYLQLGIASTSDLSELILTIVHSDHRKEELRLEKIIGLQKIVLENVSTGDHCEVSVKNVSSVRKVSRNLTL
jgi:biotin operon repressor